MRRKPTIFTPRESGGWSEGRSQNNRAVFTMDENLLNELEAQAASAESEETADAINYAIVKEEHASI